MQVGTTTRKVSVFVAVLCCSRLMFIEFTLSQHKAEFYRGVVHALKFFGGSPRAIIFDNLKATVLNGSGRTACFYPEFLALCGYFCLQPIPCDRRDPESKGIVERGVRYVKNNALAGRAEELTRFEDYLALAPLWRDQVANVRVHETTRERPVDRFQRERALPGIAFDTDEVVPAVVNTQARAGEDQRPPASLAGPGTTLRHDGGACRHLPSLGVGDLRRRICREPSVGGTLAATASHAHSAHSQAARIDRRDRIRACRSRYLRPSLHGHRGELSWHDVTTIYKHGWTATWPN